MGPWRNELELCGIQVPPDVQDVMPLTLPLLQTLAMCLNSLPPLNVSQKS